MMIFLLTILAVALAMIFVGVCLSRKNLVLPQRREIYRGRIGENRPIYVRSSAMQAPARTSISGYVFGRQLGEIPWSSTVLVLLCLLVLGISLLGQRLPGPALIFASLPEAFGGSTNSQSASQVFSGLSGASKALTRIGQSESSQYSSPQEYNTWWPSTCSAAAMTEVINAYGHQYRIADILKVETSLGEITPELGLLQPTGIDHTVARFGFQATWLHNPSLDNVMAVANHGRPVIVSFPPSRWQGGHILVVLGGDNTYVYTADSSRLDIHAFTHKDFLKYWADFAVVVTPIPQN